MIIALEGINGSGKTTVGNLLIAELRDKRGLSAIAVDPAQLTEYSRGIRGCIMAESGLGADTEMLAFASARLHGAPIVREMADQDGVVVILERWSGALRAYGVAENVDLRALRMIEELMAASLVPDHQLLVDVSAELADERLYAQTESRNKFETRGAEYLGLVRSAYLAWANDRAVTVLDASQGDVGSSIERFCRGI